MSKKEPQGIHRLKKFDHINAADVVGIRDIVEAHVLETLHTRRLMEVTDSEIALTLVETFKGRVGVVIDPTGQVLLVSLVAFENNEAQQEFKRQFHVTARALEKYAQRMKEY